jgi:anti-sigma regulatory factor (Ser/Thr protein kinase)
MQPHEGAFGNGRPRAPAESVAARSELDSLRLACRRQARVIEQLSAVASNMRSGAAALRAENAELRAANERIARPGGVGARGGLASAGGAPDVCLPLDARAPGAARIVVGGLSGRVPLSLVEDAQLIVSELVSNSVRHSGASAGAVVLVRVGRTGTRVRVEVEDSGRAGVIAPRAPDLDGGFGLNLVQELSERWGLERVAAGGTRVWAQLARAPASAEASAFGAAGDRLEMES